MGRVGVGVRVQWFPSRRQSREPKNRFCDFCGDVWADHVCARVEITRASDYSLQFDVDACIQQLLHKQLLLEVLLCEICEKKKVLLM